MAALQAQREPVGQPDPQPEGPTATEPEESEALAPDAEAEEVTEEAQEGELEANPEEESEEAETWEINGKSYTAEDIQELERGGMMERDYRQKTMEVAEQRRVNETREQTAAFGLGIVQQRALGKLQRLSEIDFVSLANENPQAYQVKMAEKQQAEQEVRELDAQTRQFLEQIKTQEEERQAKAAVNARETLQRRVKGWNEQVYYSDLEHGKSLGAEPDELNAETRPWVLEALHKARLFDEGKAVATKKRRRPAQTLTQGRSTENQNQGKKAMETLHKSGDMEDALTAMRSRRS